MNCQTFWACVALHIESPILAFLYDSRLVLLLPVFALITFMYALSRSRQARTYLPRKRSGYTLLILALAACVVVTLLPAMLILSESLAFNILAIPPGTDVFRLDSVLLDAAANILVWLGWMAIGATLLVGYVALVLMQHLVPNKLISEPPRDETSSPTSSKVDPGSVTPIPGSAPGRYSPKPPSAPSSISGADKTIVPVVASPVTLSERFEPPQDRVAWLALEWQDGRPVADRYSRWRIDDRRSPCKVGRQTSENSQLPNFIPLTGAPLTVSKEQLLIGAEPKMGYFLLNIGKAPIQVAGRQIATGSDQEPIRLRPGTSIVVEQIELIFSMLGTPVLQISEVSSVSQPTVRHMPSRFSLGGPEGNISLDHPQKVADVFFDLRQPVPQYVIVAASTQEGVVTVRRSDDSEIQVESQPVPLHNNDHLIAGVWDLHFQIPLLPEE